MIQDSTKEEFVILSARGSLILITSSFIQAREHIDSLPYPDSYRIVRKKTVTTYEEL